MALTAHLTAWTDAEPPKPGEQTKPIDLTLQINDEDTFTVSLRAILKDAEQSLINEPGQIKNLAIELAALADEAWARLLATQESTIEEMRALATDQASGVFCAETGRWHYPEAWSEKFARKQYFKFIDGNPFLKRVEFDYRNKTAE